MSKTLETIHAQENLINVACHSSIKNKHKRVLQSRENIFKPKCNKELKKKLKKYKLRKDGIEDPDILDVSKILVTSLRIKSPNNQDRVNCSNIIIKQEKLNQENYLIKMVRKKKNCSEVKSLVSFINDATQNEHSSMNILVEDKKHMDAFKLMMEARNKSIGSNSPGKEKIEEEESKEMAERKDIKTKRNLLLQKMALSKGSQKNKEIEELRDKCIEKKLVQRAETFKQMITNTKCIKSAQKTNTSVEHTLPSNDLKLKPESNKSLKLCDIFNETIEIIDQTKQSKKISKEDIEFLNKLSPSIKKKENMLSYFQKLPKDETEQLQNRSIDENTGSIIKVKFNLRRKKKKKRLKLTKELVTAESIENTNVGLIVESNESHINGHKRVKRKRNLNVEDEVSLPPQTDLDSLESRPKRNVKKPIKYAEDIQIFSSDEELQTFTPKKKKNNEKSFESKINKKKSQVVNIMEPVNEKKNYKIDMQLPNKDSKNKLKLNKRIAFNHTKDANNVLSKSLKLNNENKVLKLAPIFVSKTQLSPADFEAKQKFLLSGVPEKLKKKVSKPVNEVIFDEFPSVIHVQQNNLDTSLHQEIDWIKYCSNFDESYLTQNEYSYKTLLKLEETCNFSLPVVSKIKPKKVLKRIKCTYPKFPVYRTFHLLSGKKKGELKDCQYPDLDNSVEIINGHSVDVNNENPDQLNWCDKYKPISSKQIIGNFGSIKELKKWLETWTENLFKTKQIASDSSDFSDFYHSDTDSRDVNRNTNNVLILTGQSGSGKTSSVYAVASELAIKVIEVNASSKRTGKIMLQDLQEATQSHKVDRGKSSSDNSQKLQDKIMTTNIKKKGRPKKNHIEKFNLDAKSKLLALKKSEMSQVQILASQDNARMGMSLILIDDADVIFEQDDGFCSAIGQLIQSSKRPVILVTSSLTCPHLQRFIQYGKVLHLQPTLSRMLGTWLDIMCLADVGNCCPGLGAKVLDFFRGDVRKTIHFLQFYMSSSKHRRSQEEEVGLSQLKHKIDDEDSNVSWMDSESLEVPSSNKEAEFYIEKQLDMLHLNCPLNMFNVWWNLSRFYKECNNTGQDSNLTSIQNYATQDASEGLNTIAHVLDTMSLTDYFDHNDQSTCANISMRPWHSSENASSLDNENFECYNKSSFVTREISDVLIKNMITKAQKVFKCENSFNFLPPSMSEQRKRDKIVNQHIELSSYLHSSSMLDRRAIALDYWPTCRTICRIERNRTDTYMKRNNRFCHYLKSLNVLRKNDFFDSLADSLT